MMLLQPCQLLRRKSLSGGKRRLEVLARQPSRRSFEHVGIKCQSALDRDPRSASNRDPLVLRFGRLALAPSELVGVAETGQARVGVIASSTLEAPAIVAGLDDIAVVS